MYKLRIPEQYLKKSEATVMTDNKKYTGNLLDKDPYKWNSSDTDYYKYTATKAGTATICFGLKDSDIENVGKGWQQKTP